MFDIIARMKIPIYGWIARIYVKILSMRLII
jgi:hypothetical protein